MSGTNSQSTPLTLQQIATDAANAFSVPVNLFLSQIQAESGWNPNAVSTTPVNTPSGTEYAQGIAQFLPETAQQLGVNAFNPTSALYGAAKYDSQLYQADGTWAAAMSSYGTLPSNPTNATLNPDQQAVLAAAQSADGTSTSTGPTASIQNRAAAEAGIMNALTGTQIPTSPAPSSPCSGISGVFTFSCWQGIIGDLVIIGVGVILVAGAIIIVGKTDIVQNTVSTGKRAFA